MAWVFPLYTCARIKLDQRSKRPCFSWALLCVGLVLANLSPSFATEAKPTQANLAFDPDLKPFTSAQLRVLYQLINQAKKRVTPEYYLSEEYLAEQPLISRVANRDFVRQTKWKQDALERRKFREENRAERAANQARIQKLREQERNIQRLQREARIARHRHEYCARIQRQARYRQHSRFANQRMYHTHPNCS